MSISDGIIWDEQKGEEADSARMFINDVQIPVNEAFGKALKIMFDAEETINSVTPAERKKCNEIVQKYIGEPAEEYGFRKSRFDRPKDMVHEWIFERTVDAVSQSIVIREQPLAKGKLYLSCDGGSTPIETEAVYDNSIEGFEKAILQLEKYMKTVGFAKLELAIQINDRIKCKDYVELYNKYEEYADAFYKSSELSRDVSLSEKLRAIENKIRKCNKRGMSFKENKEDLFQAAGCFAEILLEIPGTELKLAKDKSDCYIERSLEDYATCPLSIIAYILLLWEKGVGNATMDNQFLLIYTMDEFRKFKEKLGVMK